MLSQVLSRCILSAQFWHGSKVEALVAAVAAKESAALPFVIPSSQLACGKLREK
jgi:hypothetical protein